MMRFFRLVILLCCALTLTACVSREQADARLAKGCAAGAAALLPEGQELGTVTNQHFTPAVEGPNMRHVSLTVGTQDGWIEENTLYECVFEEHFGFLNSTYTASLHNLKVGEQVYGKSGGQIVGDVQDFVKLTDAIRKAMYE